MTKLKREYVKLYFAESCGGWGESGGGAKSKGFWPTIRPFLTNKGSICDEKITIAESNKVLTDTNEICEKSNTFL